MFRHFHLNGQPHRDPIDGPAIEDFRDDGTVIARYFYTDGNVLSDAEVAKILGSKPASKQWPAWLRKLQKITLDARADLLLRLSKLKTVLKNKIRGHHVSIDNISS